MAINPLYLKLKVIRLLSLEFGTSGNVSMSDDQVMLVISRADYEQRLGDILQRIHRVIDEYCPHRSEHLFILVLDDAGIYENNIKIWKSALWIGY